MKLGGPMVATENGVGSLFRAKATSGDSETGCCPKKTPAPLGPPGGRQISPTTLPCNSLITNTPRLLEKWPAKQGTSER